ncbi:hypothetical protein BDW59DRAFT_112405 [Aspergillus cavernicola]|uniref:Uncharacterized protein n=1 Tax=Aspergillus cavernicola TaxID=176166 RepID=A0ABR4I1L9_9EURO
MGEAVVCIPVATPAHGLGPWSKTSSDGSEGSKSFYRSRTSQFPHLNLSKGCRKEIGIGNTKGKGGKVHGKWYYGIGGGILDTKQKDRKRIRRSDEMKGRMHC